MNKRKVYSLYFIALKCINYINKIYKLCRKNNKNTTKRKDKQ